MASRENLGSAEGLKDSVGSEEGEARLWDKDEEDGKVAIVEIFRKRSK